MRSLGLVALLVSGMALAGTDSSFAEKKAELAMAARTAAQALGTYEYYLDDLQALPTRKLKALELEPFVLLPAQEWGPITPSGIWSIGKQSSLYFRLDEDAQPRQLLIQGLYFNGQEQTRLFVNGQLLSESPLNDLTIELPSSLMESSHLHVELHHLNPVAPRDIEPNRSDRRLIKFKLQEIRVW